MKVISNAEFGGERILATPEHFVGIVYLYVLDFDVVHLAEHLGGVDTCVRHFQIIGMFSSNIRIDGLESDSKYVFQYVKNVELRNAKITTKDAFWEVENVTIYDSELNGEYLGWHSHNLRLVNCHITGEQPLCYAHDLVRKIVRSVPTATGLSSTVRCRRPSKAQ